MIYYMKLHEVGNFNKTKVLKSPIKKSKKKILLKSKMHSIKVKKWFLMLLKMKYFHYKQLKEQVMQI